jgi:hypothetical protein
MNCSPSDVSPELSSESDEAVPSFEDAPLEPEPEDDEVAPEGCEPWTASDALCSSPAHTGAAGRVTATPKAIPVR